MLSKKRLNEIAEQSWKHSPTFEEMSEMARELNRIEPRLAELEARYAFEENQRLCVGYEGKCDGDLTGTEHEEDCPARKLDVTLRPHLYVRNFPDLYVRNDKEDNDEHE